MATSLLQAGLGYIIIIHFVMVVIVWLHLSCRRDLFIWCVFFCTRVCGCSVCCECSQCVGLRCSFSLMGGGEEGGVACQALTAEGGCLAVWSVPF